jgi:hypothetical protein
LSRIVSCGYDISAEYFPVLRRNVPRYIPRYFTADTEKDASFIDIYVLIGSIVGHKGIWIVIFSHGSGSSVAQHGDSSTSLRHLHKEGEKAKGNKHKQRIENGNDFSILLYNHEAKVIRRSLASHAMLFMLFTPKPRNRLE